MTATGLLFAVVGAVSGIGFVASLARPVWFRFNGGVPRRWKIGATWLVLVAVSTLGALAQRNAGAVREPQANAPTESTESASDISFETFPGHAVSLPEVDVPMDAAKPAEETLDTLIDVAPPPPPPPLPAVPSRRHSRPAVEDRASQRGEHLQ